MRLYRSHLPNRRKPNALSRYLSRLFSPRSIIIISEHKTEHVPLSIRKQVTATLLILGIVAFGSFAAGDYFSAQATLREKERLIANSHLKNRRIEGEFALLKRDLVSMIEKENQGDMSEYAKLVIDQYRDAATTDAPISADAAPLAAGKHDAVFERIAFLERTVEDIKHEHETIIAAIEETAQGRLGDLEKIVAMTGICSDKAEAMLREELSENDTAHLSDESADSSSPRGGPYKSVPEDLLRSYNSDLYSSLKRLVVLEELVTVLPLEEPMRDYELSSGFGVRLDPFRKRPAQHDGLDFSGPEGAKVYSANDGIVTHAGRNGAYGNMIDIDHGASITTRYGHLSKLAVEEGQRVRKGQLIGVQGSTGRSTGPHLHYEVHFRGSPINPKNFIKAGKYVRTIEEEKRVQIE